MKKMSLLLPRKAITLSQHCRCSWCESGVDPGQSGVCRTCHNKLQALLCSSKWTLLRRSYLATVETGMCHGFIVMSKDSSVSTTAPLLRPTTAPLLPLTISERISALLSLPLTTPLLPYYHPCHSSVTIPATRIDHILPWRCYPSLFWQCENHQSLCTSCNAKKTQLDGSHRTDVRRSK
jgi:hypothetical protein